MPDQLLRYILGRLERFPDAVFWENELRAVSDKEFDLLKRQKMLCFVQTDLGDATYPCPTNAAGCVDRVLIRQAGKLLAVCPCPAEAAPIELASKDVRRYQVDVRELAEQFHRVNELTGTPAALEDRLFFLGQARTEGMSVGLVLAFVGDERDGLPILRQLPVLLSAFRCDRFHVVCPGFEPSVQARRELETLQIDVVPLGKDDPFRLDMETRGISSARGDVDPMMSVRAMKETLLSWGSERRPGVGQALVHIVDHVPLRDHAAAAKVVGELGYPLDQGRLHQLLYDGRRRLKKGIACTFCPQLASRRTRS